MSSTSHLTLFIAIFMFSYSCQDSGFVANSRNADKPEPPVDPVPVNKVTFTSTPVLDLVFFEKPGTEMTLTGKVRDFLGYTAGSPATGHPDFEQYNSGFKVGMIAETLDAEGKPVYNNTIPYGGVTSVESFAQWYRDVVSVNQSEDLNITLSKDPATGIYTYDNQEFFPIDNKLLGNEGRLHNFHFTYEIKNTFTYKGGETFSFRGDDDLWVFIDNKLVIDLGGVHGALEETVNLDTLGLEVGKDYSFALFFAERHTNKSSFRIDTTIQIKNQAPYQYTAQAKSDDGSEVFYELVKGPEGLTVDKKTGAVTWTSDKVQAGAHEIEIKASNAAGDSDTQSYTLNVAAKA